MRSACSETTILATIPPMRLLESFTHDPRIAEPLDGRGDGGRRIGGIRKMTFQLASQPLALADVLDLRVTHGAVDRFYKAGLAAGGKDNGAPGLRKDYSPKYYAAFLLDPDGNNVEAVCHLPE